MAIDAAATLDTQLRALDDHVLATMGALADARLVSDVFDLRDRHPVLGHPVVVLAYLRRDQASPQPFDASAPSRDLRAALMFAGMHRLDLLGRAGVLCEAFLALNDVSEELAPFGDDAGYAAMHLALATETARLHRAYDEILQELNDVDVGVEFRCGLLEQCSSLARSLAAMLSGLPGVEAEAVERAVDVTRRYLDQALDVSTARYRGRLVQLTSAVRSMVALVGPDEARSCTVRLLALVESTSIVDEKLAGNLNQLRYALDEGAATPVSLDTAPLRLAMAAHAVAVHGSDHELTLFEALFGRLADAVAAARPLDLQGPAVARLLECVRRKDATAPPESTVVEADPSASEVLGHVASRALAWRERISGDGATLDFWTRWIRWPEPGGSVEDDDRARYWWIQHVQFLELMALRMIGRWSLQVRLLVAEAVETGTAVVLHLWSFGLGRSQLVEDETGPMRFGRSVDLAGHQITAALAALGRPVVQALDPAFTVGGGVPSLHSTDESWQQQIESFIDFADVVVVSLAEGSEGVMTEIVLLRERGRLASTIVMAVGRARPSSMDATDRGADDASSRIPLPPGVESALVGAATVLRWDGDSPPWDRLADAVEAVRPTAEPAREGRPPPTTSPPVIDQYLARASCSWLAAAMARRPDDPSFARRLVIGAMVLACDAGDAGAYIAASVALEDMLTGPLAMFASTVAGTRERVERDHFVLLDLLGGPPGTAP